MNFLLHHHANPNLKDHRDEAPLHAAVRTGNLEVVEVFHILFDFNQVFNRPFYRYGGNIEFTRFKEYYGMPRGHSLSIYARFSGKKITSLYISWDKGVHYYIQTRHDDLFSHYNLFQGKFKEKIGPKSARKYCCEYIGSCSCPLGIP